MAKAQSKIKIPEVWSIPEFLPLEAHDESVASTTTRKNAAALIDRTYRYSNIENGLVPFNCDNNGYWSVKDAVILCQKAYYNFPIFRNTIDLMTEFSTSEIHFKKGNKKGRDFFTALFNKINIYSLQDKFFREYFRSGTVPLYRLDALLNPESLNQLTQTYGESKAAKGKSLPIKYVILNPADIQVHGNISFIEGKYYKLLTDYELQRLRKPVTDEEKELLSSLDKQTQELIKKGGVSSIYLPLDVQKLTVISYKKQDYEPFAVPLGYGVLDDINWKAEMKKMDMAATRHVQQIVLLITMGSELKDGRINVNQKQLNAVQTMFENESVGRVIIGDYTMKGQWLIPEISNFLDPKKYAQIDKDIQIGLNNILVGEGEKFSNQTIKVQVFIERLKQAQQAFITEFLQPEIKRIAKSLGMKNYPVPYFEEFALKDELEYAKVYTRLVELGALTPAEGIKAIETGLLPNEEESLEAQEELRKNKDKGFYEPIVGGPFSQKTLQEENLTHQSKMVEKQAKLQKEANKDFDNQKLDHQEQLHQQKLVHNDQTQKVKVSQMKGRPSGTSAPKKSGMVGASVSNTYSLDKIKENLLLANTVQSEIEKSLLKKYKLKELSTEQKQLAEQVLDIVVANETPENWKQNFKNYIENPTDTNKEIVGKIEEIAYEHQVDYYLAAILHHSRKEG